MIIITKRTSDWHAQIDGEPGKWGCGKTAHEAVGDLIMSHPGDFKVALKLP